MELSKGRKNATVVVTVMATNAAMDRLVDLEMALSVMTRQDHVAIAANTRQVIRSAVPAQGAVISKRLVLETPVRVRRTAMNEMVNPVATPWGFFVLVASVPVETCSVETRCRPTARGSHRVTMTRVRCGALSTGMALAIAWTQTRRLWMGHRAVVGPVKEGGAAVIQTRVVVAYRHGSSAISP